MRRPRLFALVAVAALAVALTAVGRASAETVTVGSPLTGTPTDYEYCIPLCIGANYELAEAGAHATVPSAGTITRLRTIDASGPYRLRVLRPEGSGGYTLAGTGPTVDPTGIGLETFTVSLPAQAGDLIGLENLEKTDRLAIFKVPGSSRSADFFRSPEPWPDGTPVAEPPFEHETYGGEEIGFDVIVGEPTETTPPPAAPAPTPTTPLPSKKSPQCKVPKLKGKKLKAARKALVGAHCKLGAVTNAGAAHPPKVTAQSPASDKVRAAGTKVSVHLS